LKGNSKLEILGLSDSKTPAKKEIERYPFVMETHATHDKPWPKCQTKEA
jgi:hypothetical protein